MFQFRVDGTPVSQGSMKVINGYAIHSAGAALAVWRSTIALTAKLNEAKIFEGPVHVTLDFELKKPRTVKREYPTVPPDLDKLIRAVLDALTGQFWHDDSQVVSINSTKRYSENPGVTIGVSPIA